MSTSAIPTTTMHADPNASIHEEVVVVKEEVTTTTTTTTTSSIPAVEERFVRLRVRPDVVEQEAPTPTAPVLGGLDPAEAERLRREMEIDDMRETTFAVKYNDDYLLHDSPVHYERMGGGGGVNGSTVNLRAPGVGLSQRSHIGKLCESEMQMRQIGLIEDDSLNAKLKLLAANNSSNRNNSARAIEGYGADDRIARAPQQQRGRSSSFAEVGGGGDERYTFSNNDREILRDSPISFERMEGRGGGGGDGGINMRAPGIGISKRTQLSGINGSERYIRDVGALKEERRGEEGLYDRNTHVTQFARKYNDDHVLRDSPVSYERMAGAGNGNGSSRRGSGGVNLRAPGIGFSKKSQLGGISESEKRLRDMDIVEDDDMMLARAADRYCREEEAEAMRRRKIQQQLQQDDGDDDDYYYSAGDALPQQQQEEREHRERSSSSYSRNSKQQQQQRGTNTNTSTNSDYTTHTTQFARKYNDDTMLRDSPVSYERLGGDKKVDYAKARGGANGGIGFSKKSQLGGINNSEKEMRRLNLVEDDSDRDVDDYERDTRPQQQQQNGSRSLFPTLVGEPSNRSGGSTANTPHKPVASSRRAATPSSASASVSAAAPQRSMNADELGRFNRAGIFVSNDPTTEEAIDDEGLDGNGAPLYPIIIQRVAAPLADHTGDDKQRSRSRSASVSRQSSTHGTSTSVPPQHTVRGGESLGSISKRSASASASAQSKAPQKSTSAADNIPKLHPEAPAARAADVAAAAKKDDAPSASTSQKEEKAGRSASRDRSHGTPPLAPSASTSVAAPLIMSTTNNKAANASVSNQSTATANQSTTSTAADVSTSDPAAKKEKKHKHHKHKHHKKDESVTEGGEKKEKKKHRSGSSSSKHPNAEGGDASKKMKEDKVKNSSASKAPAAAASTSEDSKNKSKSRSLTEAPAPVHPSAANKSTSSAAPNAAAPKKEQKQGSSWLCCGGDEPAAQKKDASKKK